MNATAHPLILDISQSSRRRAQRRARPADDLTTLCSKYIELARAFDASDATCEDDDPHWQALQAAENRIDEIEPETMADVVALAKLAEHHARQVDGSMNYSDSFTGHTPARIIECLLRLAEQTHG